MRFDSVKPFGNGCRVRSLSGTQSNADFLNQLEKTMEKYIGTKLILALPMIAQAFEAQQGKASHADDLNAAGYLVEYDTGYRSWSPKAAFEEAYRRTDGMNFGLAIEAMKKGLKVARRGWNGKGIHIEIQNPDENSKMSSPYIFIDTTGLQTDNPDAPKSRVPWLASQTDMLADDWQVVD